ALLRRLFVGREACVPKSDSDPCRERLWRQKLRTRRSVRLRAQFDKTFVDMNPPDLAARQGLFTTILSPLCGARRICGAPCGADFQSAADFESAWPAGSQPFWSWSRGSRW